MKKCNFCKNTVEDCFEGVDDVALICSDCITSLNEVLNNKNTTNNNKNNNDNTLMSILSKNKPKDIIKHLDKYIIGQEEAKEVMAISFYNHFKRIILNDPDIQKSNVLLIGPSGSGKTLITSKISELLEFPFVSVDATKFTEAGYIGSDVEDILTELLLNANGNIEETEKGIVHIDEWDKLAETQKSGHQVNKKGVQESFLRMIEGGDFYVSNSLNKKDHDAQKVKINTKNILFICSGAFEKIYPIIKKRMNVNKSIGFNSTFENENNDYSFIKFAEDSDFIKYGLMKEIIARLPFKTYVNELEKEDLKKIITEPKDSIIKGYQKLLKLDNADLVFEECAIDEVATIALSQKTGARALKSILDNKLKDVMIEASKSNKKTKILIDKDYINGLKNAKDIIK